MAAGQQTELEEQKQIQSVQLRCDRPEAVTGLARGDVLQDLCKRSPQLSPAACKMHEKRGKASPTHVTFNIRGGRPLAEEEKLKAVQEACKQLLTEKKI